jgi:hypothetical protein
MGSDLNVVQVFPPSLRYGEARRSAKREGGTPAGKADLNVLTTSAGDGQSGRILTESLALKENAGLRPKKPECLRFPQRGREGFVDENAKVQERTKK